MQTYTNICLKMNKVIESSSEDQKDIVRRYLSLANKQLHKEFKYLGDWGIIGASYAIKSNFENKFGKFIPCSKFIKG